MKKQSFFLAALVFSAFSLDLAATSSKKSFLQQLLTARPYKDDLQLNLFGLAELNITQTANITLAGLLLATATNIRHFIFECSKQEVSTIPSAMAKIFVLAPAATLYIATVIPGLTFTYRTLNAERIIPIRFDCDSDEVDEASDANKTVNL